ncbi:unnamed protein product [Triticum aestivum]|uniref:Uncharacterized protein n=1 Tax=Triticum aestivum TaxID=4565 RepID=A0A7H4LL48_WHEAT|nr:unnamed protein product [Triticum aestivum]
MNIELSKPYTPKEVKVALFQMAPSKAPGVDGFTAGFYQRHWDLLGNDVTAAVLDFLNGGELPSGLNDTSITLIPKVNGELLPYFTPSRGFRQGDPVSPFLFLLCAEGFSSLLKYYSGVTIDRGLRVSYRSPWVTHLLFADDSLIFHQCK